MILGSDKLLSQFCPNFILYANLFVPEIRVGYFMYFFKLNILVINY